MLNGFETYQLYLALKRHFDSNSNYDYFKYHGKVRANRQSFDIRKDRFFFVKISKKFNDYDELRNFFVANMVTNSNSWIGELVREDAFSVYQDWKRRQQSLGYLIDSDFKKIIEDLDTNDTRKAFNDLFICVDGQHPLLLSLYTQSDILIETLISFDLVFGCFEKWNKEIVDSIIWPSIYTLCQRYVPFLDIDKSRCQKGIIDFIK